MKYVVVRDYSGPTAKHTLWKVLSRPFTDLQDAIQWMEWMKTEEGWGKQFRILCEVEPADLQQRRIE
jgi:hypothetical protein